MDTELETPAGSIILKRVEFRILAGASKEILIGRSELARLELPSFEDSLEAAVVKAKLGKQATVELKSKDVLIPTGNADLTSINVLVPTEIAESNSTKGSTDDGKKEMVNVKAHGNLVPAETGALISNNG